MDFPTALSKCLAGARITNMNWNGKGMYVFPITGVEVPGNFLSGIKAMEISLPFLMMKNANGDFVPWLISNMDVFSNNWIVLD